MKNLVGRWEEDANTRGMAKITIDGYRWAIKNFEKFCSAHDVRLRDADRLILRAYVDSCRQRNLTTRTIGSRLGAVSNFFEFLVFEGLRKNNPVIEIRKRYLSPYKTDSERHTHKLISVEEMAHLIACAMDIRDKAMLCTLAKTGVRRGELISMEVSDIDFVKGSILLKPKKKRSNRVVFFDDETAYLLRRWLEIRKSRRPHDDALWISSWGKRIDRGGVWYIIEKIALQAGLHDPTSPRMEDHFSAHCFRHWFSTYLSRSGMPERYIEWLRGDVARGSIGVYIHMDVDQVRESYLAHIPQLGI